MAKRICLCLSHSIEEHDQLKLLSGLGYEVVSLGGYINPHAPHDPKRPALPDVPHYPELQAAVDAQGSSDNLGDAQAHIPGEILEWLGDDGILIYHHYLDRLYQQWDYLEPWRKKGGRIIWRTVGQSVEGNEEYAHPYVRDGLEIVRYSPKERAIPCYAGENALIRFYSDPAEWQGWSGEIEGVINITQELMRRGPFTNPEFWTESVKMIPAVLLGPGSETGEMPLERMKEALRRYRCYLYTGTQPASYTLGLIEALMTGIPVVSIGPSHMTNFPYGPDLFEGHELAPLYADDPAEARNLLQGLLGDPLLAASVSQHQRWRAIKTFGIDVIGKQWKEYLG